MGGCQSIEDGAVANDVGAAVSLPLHRDRWQELDQLAQTTRRNRERRIHGLDETRAILVRVARPVVADLLCRFVAPYRTGCRERTELASKRTTAHRLVRHDGVRAGKDR